MIRLYISIDRWLNRILLLLVAAAIVVVIIDEFDNPVPYPPIPRGAMNADLLITVVQSKCADIDARIEYFQTCAEEFTSDPDRTSHVCSAVIPAGVDLMPLNAVHAITIVTLLESHKTSLGCNVAPDSEQKAGENLEMSNTFMEALQVEDHKAPDVDRPEVRSPGLSAETETKNKETQNDQN